MFGEVFRKYSSPEYHFVTSKKQKLADKKELDENVSRERSTLAKISKLTLGDFPASVRLPGELNLFRKGGPGLTKASRKDKIAGLRLQVLKH